MIFVGVDPGVSGGLVFLSDTSRILLAEPLPTITLRKSRKQIDGRKLSSQLRALTEQGIEALVTIEDVHAFPGQGVSSTFSFGAAFGHALGVIEALGLRYQLVTPQRWQKALLAGTGEPKRRAQLAAHRLWLAAPHHKGIIDALLIAEYGRRTWRAAPTADTTL